MTGKGWIRDQVLSGMYRA